MRFSDPILDELPDRVRSKIQVDEAGCWVWTASMYNGGYGRIRFEKKDYVAHRLVYELLVSQIPAGLQLDHLCRVRTCVNPAHLEPVTCRENLMRGETHAAANAAKTHCVHGHALEGDNLVMRRGYRTCRRCARDATDAWTGANRDRVNAGKRRRAAEVRAATEIGR